MRRAGLRTHTIWILLTAVAALALMVTGRLRAADSGFPIYFESSTLVVNAQIVKGVTYLPLVDIVRRLGLPYTDALALETFTIRAGNARLVLTENSPLISVNDQIVSLPSPVLRENGQWLVSVDFLSIGLSPLTGTAFQYRPGMSRVFAGGTKSSELAMNAQALGPITRLTLRSEAPIRLEARLDAQEHRVVLKIDGIPMDPLRERLDYSDRLIRSIAFDDADGMPKILVATTEAVTDVRVAAAEENKVYFVDFVRDAAVTEAAPAPAGAPAAAPARVDAPPSGGGVRVVVIDPGHGGPDIGTANAGTIEKDLTLIISRLLRSALQSRLGATVLLTRDSDVALSSEARSTAANNNQADLLISLHIGYSVDQLNNGSIYLMNREPATPAGEASDRQPLFLPWYQGHRPSQGLSRQLATAVQEEWSRAMPGWKLPIRNGPIAVLASATMPAIALEVGNLNNPNNSSTLTDAAFQSKLVATIVAAIEHFSLLRQMGATN